MPWPISPAPSTPTFSICCAIGPPHRFFGCRAAYYEPRRGRTARLPGRFARRRRLKQRTPCSGGAHSPVSRQAASVQSASSGAGLAGPAPDPGGASGTGFAISWHARDRTARAAAVASAHGSSQRGREHDRQEPADEHRRHRGPRRRPPRRSQPPGEAQRDEPGAVARARRGAARGRRRRRRALRRAARRGARVLGRRRPRRAGAVGRHAGPAAAVSQSLSRLRQPLRRDGQAGRLPDPPHVRRRRAGGGARL